MAYSADQGLLTGEWNGSTPRAGTLFVGRCQMSWGRFVGHLRVIHYLALMVWKIDEEHAFLSCLKRLLSPKNRSVNYSKEREREREVKEGQEGGRAEQPLADVCTRPCSIQQVCMWTLLALELDSQGIDHGLETLRTCNYTWPALKMVLTPSMDASPNGEAPDIHKFNITKQGFRVRESPLGRVTK